MGLRIKGTSGLGHKITTLVASFVLVAQPLVALNLPAVFAAGGEILYVAIDGADGTDCTSAPCATIQHAIDQANNGDTVQVGAGTFAGDIKLNKDVSLVGNGNSGLGATTIESAISNNAITIQSHLANRQNITIKNFILNDMLMVTNNTGANHPGYDTRNLILENLNVNAHGYYGILLQSIDRVSLTRVVVDNASYGIEMNGVSNATVAHSTVKNSTVGVNIQLVPGYGANNTINFSGTTFNGNSQAFKAVGARNITLAAGAIWGGRNAVSFKDVTHSEIKGVQLNKQESAGNLAVIELIGTASHIDIKNNFFNYPGTISKSTGNTAQAILVGDTGQSGNLRFINISNNSIRNISGERGGFALMVNRPMSMESGAQLKFINNTVDGIHGGAWMAGLGLDENTPNAEITGNTFSNLSTASGTPVAINVNHREGNTSDPTSMTIKQNNFNTPGQIGVNYDWAHGTAPSLNKHLDASENFWGTPAGPGKAGGASVGTFTKYSNWLCGPAPSSETSSGESKGCVQPIIEAVTPGKGAAIKGVQRVYVTVKNPEVVSGGFLQLNKALDTGNPLNANRTNYPLKKDGDQWYAEVDTKNIVALSGGGHQGDGKYLFQIEVHHKYGHSTSTPWGYYGAGVGSWHKGEFFFIVDNTAPEVKSATLNDSPANIAPRNKNVGSTDFNLVGGKFTLGLTVEDATDTTLVRYRVAKVNNSGGTQSSIYRSNWFNMANASGNNWTASEFDTAIVGSVHPDLLGDLVTDGTYTIQIETRDSLGNTFSHKYVDINVDNTAPVVGLVGPVGITNSNSVTVSGWAHDDNMRYYACYITTNQPITAFGKGWTTGQEPKTGAANKQSLADSACVTTFGQKGTASSPANLGSFDVSGLPDGSYTIYLHAHDLLKNTNTVSTQFTIDRTAPVLEFIDIESAPDEDMANAYTITGTTSDPSTAVKLRINGQAHGASVESDGSWSLLVSLPIGSYEIIASSTDAAGNVADEVKIEYSWNVLGDGTNTPASTNKTSQGKDKSKTSAPGPASGISGIPPLPITPLRTPSNILAFLNSDVTDANASEREDGENAIAKAQPLSADSRVLAAQDTASESDAAGDEECGKLLGLCWYWWVAIAIGVAAIIHLVRSLRAGKGEDQPA